MKGMDWIGRLLVDPIAFCGKNGIYGMVDGLSESAEVAATYLRSSSSEEFVGTYQTFRFPAASLVTGSVPEKKHAYFRMLRLVAALPKKY